MRGVRGHTRQVEHGLGEVHVEHQRVAHRTRRDKPRVADEQRHLQRLGAHESLVVPPVFAEEEPLIGGVHDNRALGLSGRVQVDEQSPHPLVDRRDAAQVVRDVALVRPSRVRFGVQAVRRIAFQVLAVQVTADPHACFSRSTRPARVVVEERHRQVGVAVRVPPGVACGRLPRPVRRLVVHQQAPRFRAAFHLCQPVQGHVGDQVGGVPAAYM